MRLHARTTPWLALATLCFLSPVIGDERKLAFLDAEKAGPDFAVQGEYLGQVGKERQIAAQVIALGDGKFEGILYRGGLPGGGWDEKIRFAFHGEREGAVTTVVGRHGERLKFDNENLKGEIKEGVFSGTALMFLNEVKDARFRMRKIRRVSPTLGLEAPPEAIVLFDGQGASEWVNGRVTEENLLDVGTETKRKFSSIYFHLEFRTPFMPYARGMGRGNSGVYVKKDYEIQVVDSFGWNTENRKFERLSGFGRCGGIHEMVKPRVNMCFPPLSWQTYDVEYTMARFDPSGKKIAPATLTVRHNGVVIHDRYVLPATPAESPPTNERAPGPLYLQDHGNPVRYRNIWVVERD